MSNKSDIEQAQQSNEVPNKQDNRPTTQNNKSDKGLMNKLLVAFNKNTWRLVLYSCWVVLFLLGVVSCVVTLQAKHNQKKHQQEPVKRPELWQWSLIVTALLGGPILSRSLLHIILLLFDNKVWLKINAIYYIVELVESGWYVLWFGMFLLAWVWALSDNPSYIGSHSMYQLNHYTTHNQVANDTITHVIFDVGVVNIEPIITTALISILVGSVLWLIKDLLIIMMKSSFHIRVFYDRIREVCSHHQAMNALTRGSLCLKLNGKPEYGDRDRDRDKDKDKDKDRDEDKHDYLACGLCKSCRGNDKKLRIDEQRLEEVSHQEVKVSCWELKVLMKEIRETKFCHEDKVINSEKKAKEVADVLFKAILPPKYQENPISSIKVDDKDLLKHMEEKQASKMLELFKNAGFEEITEKEVQKYMAWAFKYHRALVRGLCDNGALFRDLNRCLNLALVIMTVILWLIMASKHFRDVIIVIGSGIVACAFAFGKFCKMMLDNFAFVFLVHPFDAGDYCLIDDTSVIIEDVNLLTTVALTLDDQQIHFPNAVLFRKNIINYTRSPNTSDSVVFFLSRRTTEKEIKELEDNIQSYIEKNSRIWDKEHSLVLDYDSVDSEKIKATLNIKHLFNFYVPSERKIRKSNFIVHLNTILQNYNFPIPQDAGKNSEVKKSHDAPPDQECYSEKVKISDHTQPDQEKREMETTLVSRNENE